MASSAYVSLQMCSILEPLFSLGKVLISVQEPFRESTLNLLEEIDMDSRLLLQTPEEDEQKALKEGQLTLKVNIWMLVVYEFPSSLVLPLLPVFLDLTAVPSNSQYAGYGTPLMTGTQFVTNSLISTGCFRLQIKAWVPLLINSVKRYYFNDYQFMWPFIRCFLNV